MAFKFVIFAAFATIAHGGVIGYEPHQSHHYSDATAVSYSSVSAPLASYNAASAPLVNYAAPTIKYQAPVVKYAAPAIKYQAPVVKYAAPAAYAVSGHEEEHYAPAHYEFGYSVHDPHTGDIKEQHESREGDVVKGSYSLVEADGTRRIVEYTADEHNGFNAVVHREGTPVVKAAVPVVGKYSAPLVAKVAAPVSYAAPVAKYTYAAPSHGHYYH